MAIDRILQPDQPEARNLFEDYGVMAGWIPGLLRNIEDDAIDPEGLGRIKVTCNLFSALEEMPNDYAGWVYVLEDYVNNGKMGGSHRSLQLGSQIVLLPMQGDLTKLLMLGCIHSRTDRPNPLFNRAREIHGTHSPGQVLALEDDAHAESTKAYPHGVTQQVSRKGDVIQQTQEKARIHLQADGTSRLENEKGTTFVSKNGDNYQVSEGGAVQRLHADGKVTIDTPFSSTFELKDNRSFFTGPENELGQLLGKAKKGFGGIGKLGAIAGKAKGLLGKVSGGLGNLQNLAQAADGLIEDALGQLSQIGEPLGALQSLGGASLSKLAGPLMDQASILSNLGIEAQIPQLQGILSGGNLTQLASLYFGGGALQLSGTILQQLGPLAHSPELQLQQVMDDLLIQSGESRGFGAIENLGVMGYASKLGKLKDIAFASPLDLADAADATRLQNDDASWRARLVELFERELPEFADGLIRRADIEDWIGKTQGGDWSEYDLLENLFGQGRRRSIQQTADSLAQLAQVDPQSIDAGRVKRIGQTGDLSPEAREAIAQEVGKLANLQPLVDDAMARFNKTIQASAEGAKGAIVEADQSQASMKGAYGGSRVWADDSGVGATGRGGGFSFGGLGGAVNALGPLLFSALGKSPVALNMDPQKGIALQGFATRKSQRPNVGVEVEDGEVRLGAYNADGSFAHSVRITPQGVWIDGRRWDDFYRRFETFQASVTQSISSLEQAVATGSGGVTSVNGQTGPVVIPVGAGDGGRYEFDFINDLLTPEGDLLISHGLGDEPSSIQFFDSENEEFSPDLIEILDQNRLIAKFASAMPIQGTWKVIVST